MYMSCKDPFVTKTAQTHSIKAEPLLEDDSDGDIRVHINTFFLPKQPRVV